MHGSLHVYGQERAGGDVSILGTRPGLEALRDTIVQALNDPHGIGTLPEAFDSDAIGFSVVVRELDTLRNHATPTNPTDAKLQPWS